MQLSDELIKLKLQLIDLYTSLRNSIPADLNDDQLTLRNDFKKLLIISYLLNLFNNPDKIEYLQDLVDLEANNIESILEGFDVLFEKVNDVYNFKFIAKSENSAEGNN